MKVDLTHEEIGRRLRETAHGKSFSVGTEKDRKAALMLAAGAGKKVFTRKNGKNGYTIHVLDQ